MTSALTFGMRDAAIPRSAIFSESRFSNTLAELRPVLSDWQILIMLL